MKTTSNEILANLNNKFFVSSISSNEEKNIISKFKVEELYPNQEFWKITDRHDNILFVFPCYTRNKMFNADCFYYEEFHKEAFKLFYLWLEDKNNFNYFDIQKEFSMYKCLNQKDGSRFPLSLWEDDGVLNQDITINQHIYSLPKNLTIKGNINMENSSLSFLGNGLKVEGNVYAKNSQLAVIDDTVEIKGKIFVEDSLLVSYPTNLINQIVNPKRMQQVIRDF